MTDAAEVLVVILSAFLALFLLLAIILAAILIKVVSQIKRITTVAETTAINVGKVVEGASKVAAPAMIARMAAKAFGQAMNRRRK